MWCYRSSLGKTRWITTKVRLRSVKVLGTKNGIPPHKGHMPTRDCTATFAQKETCWEEEAPPRLSVNGNRQFRLVSFAAYMFDSIFSPFCASHDQPPPPTSQVVRW